MTWRKEALRIFSDAGARLLADNDEAVAMPKNENKKGMHLQKLSLYNFYTFMHTNSRDIYVVVHMN